MLKNASFLAIVAVHTAENEPSKVGETLKKASWPGGRAAERREAGGPRAAVRGEPRG